MANQNIRIRLKAFDHRLIDNSAKEIVETAAHGADEIIDLEWLAEVVGDFELLGGFRQVAHGRHEDDWDI